jgi:type II secretory pathway pseudopilin PulG
MNMQILKKQAHRKSLDPSATGLTLIEIAIVLFIFGLILTAGLKLLQARAEGAMEATTDSKLSVIRDSLVRYLAANSRLPCPDTTFGNGPGALAFTVAAPPDGIENRAVAGDPTKACAGAFGVIPYQTLGLSRDAALDGWQNFFSYHVSNTPTPLNDWTIFPVPVGTQGSLIVQDRSVAAGLFAVTAQAAVVVVSHGKNGFGAFTSAGTRNAASTNDELENSNGDNTYIRRDRTDDTAIAGGAIDDYVLFLTTTDLFGPLVKDGSIKSSQAKLADDLLVISDILIANIARQSMSTPPPCGANNSLPASPVLANLGVPAGNQKDPWGTDYRVLVTTPTISGSTSPASAAAVTIISNGPDKAVGGGDDLPSVLTVGAVQGKLAQAFASKCP